MKSLLLEAYVKGQQELLYVVPFVAKVLESSIRSLVSKCYLWLICERLLAQFPRDDSFVLMHIELVQYTSSLADPRSFVKLGEVMRLSAFSFCVFLEWVLSKNGGFVLVMLIV